ncbi:WD repeat-containing protein 64-like [Dendronephthya gigantea]|uniref:WD repeat-containing protein 64-like n=1 Tax=Dendronephthya gigantea TaxID=151771 RepID=UPI001069B945|nr:WD repeat-containing protein 64-like [Dendronephthya gigantea]
MEQRKTSSRPFTVGSFGRKLELFDRFIEEFTHVDEELNPEERRLELQERLTNGYEPFCAEIKSLFGADVNSHDVKALFRKIAANPEAEVDWSELFGIGNTGQEQTEQLLADEGFSVFTVSKRRYLGDAGGDKKRRDFIRNITYVPKLDIFISSSEKGIVCQWSSKFRLQSCIDINETSWITGCDYCPGLRRIIITCERSLAIWDYRAKQKQSNIIQIKPLEQMIHCMTYVPRRLDNIPDDCILFGDDHGFINILRLSSKDLHMKNAGNDAQTMIIEPSKLTNEIIRRKVHNDWVIKVKYFPQLELFGSCSPCSTTSFVLGDLDKLLAQQPLRELSVPKGVNCFDYCARANVIATAGADKIIRMWHPLIFTRPTGKLIGHLFTISELTVNENDQHLISLSTARVFRIWDVQTLTCLQVFTSSDTNPSEKRISTMLYDPKRDRLITGCGSIEMWPLTRAIQDSLQLPHTHDRSLAQVLYNSQMNQVVTICLEPVLKVWEMETGHLVYHIQEPHGPGHEVTALNVNTTGYRLITGGYDGSMKVWDFGSGQLHKSYHHSLKDSDIKDSTITGVVYFHLNGKQCVLVSSWGHTIRVFEDNVSSDSLELLLSLSDAYVCPPTPKVVRNGDEVFTSKAPLPPIGETTEFAATEDDAVNLLSTCQVTCLDYFSPRLLAAGTTVGIIILWDIEQGKVIRRFERAESRGGNSRRTSKHSHDSEYKLVHACKIISCQKSGVSRGITSVLGTTAQKDDNVDIEATSNPDSDKNDRTTDTEKNEENEDEDEHFEVNENEIDDEREIDDDVNIDEEASRFSDGGMSEDDERKSAVDEDDQKFHENEETQFQQSLDNLGVISAHHDGYIRFWNYEGTLFTEVRMTVNQRSSSVTALSYQPYSNLLITSDVRGYVMMWDIENFLHHLCGNTNGTNDSLRGVDQVIYWRAHLNKIVAMEQVKNSDVLITASVDSSVRVWHQGTGHFIGFFGQPRLWNIPNASSIPSTPLRPYDISEAPKKLTRQTKLVKNKPKTNETVDCPLAFDDERWKPFRYSAKDETRSTQDNKKFFHSLSKPRHYNFHLDSSQSRVNDPAAVFRSLPVYKIDEPERLRTPAVNSSSWLTNPITGTTYAASKPIAAVNNNEVAKNLENLITRFPHAVHHRR